MKRRVAVTGLGAVTPIGNTAEEFWNGIREGRVGIGPITKFDASGYEVKIAAEVKGFVAKERLDFKSAKRMELFSQYAVAAAKEAFADAGIDLAQEDPYRAGVIIGSGIGSLKTVEDNYTRIVEKTFPCESADGAHDDLQHGGRKRIHPAWFERKMHQRGDGLRHRNQLHRRRIPGHSVRRRGYHAGRRDGELYLPYGCGRIYRADGAVQNRGPA